MGALRGGGVAPGHAGESTERGPGDGRLDPHAEADPGAPRPGPRPAGLGHAVEILVLDGELWLGNRRLGRFDYAYLPAGASVPRFGAPDEATVLFMPDAALSVTDPDDSMDVDVKTTGDMEWEGVSQYASADWTEVGAGIKILHQDEDTGEMSWILASLPQRTGIGVEVHPVVEEAYQLLGAIQGDRGLLDAGSYFWRPPDVPHGPFSNEIGSMTFFRTRGGPLETEYILETDEIE